MSERPRSQDDPKKRNPIVASSVGFYSTGEFRCCWGWKRMSHVVAEECASSGPWL